MALVLVLPIVDRLMGHEDTALWLLVSLSAIVCCWTPLFNAVFDKVAHARTAMEGAKRHWKMRTAHAVLLEISVVCMTTPIVSWWNDLSLGDAVFLNLQISCLYIVYAYLFFLLWDKASVQVGRRKSQHAHASQ